MKKLLLTLALFCVVAIQPARAIQSPVLPFLGPLRNEVVNQQITASNATVIDKKLLASLKKALKTIDKTKSNYVAGAKSLGVLAKNLNGTSVSNAFAGDFEGTVADYVAALGDEQDALADRLATTFPSKVHTSAGLNLQQLLDALDGANTNGNVILAAKFLGVAAKKFGAAQKLVVKAEGVAAPPASVTATVSGSSSFAYKSTLAAAIAVNSGNGLINSAQAVLKAPYGQRGVVISLVGVNSGANTLAIGGDASGLSELLVTELYGNGSHSTYGSTTGTLNVTYNPSTKSLVGTFTATCVDGAKTITITGSFSANTL